MKDNPEKKKHDAKLVSDQKHERAYLKRKYPDVPKRVLDRVLKIYISRTDLKAYLDKWMKRYR